MLQERQQVDFGSRVGLKETGIPCEAQDGQSLAASFPRSRKSPLVRTPDRTPCPQMHQRARDRGVEPQF